MDVKNKVKVLSEGAKYDVSCSSSGSTRNNSSGGLGNAALGGICHSWSEDGRCISLLKILFTNQCIYDCAYCVNRVSLDIPRTAFTPDELAQLTVNFYKRNYIEGLFLSSAVKKNPDYTMELLLETVRKLRKEYNFNGYIHLKVIPGADLKLVNKAGKFADRMSVNIELPTEKSLTALAPDKSKQSILNPMKNIGENIEENRDDKNKYQNTPDFVPAGQSTQLIVGASPESDFQILRLSQSLYNKFHLKRVYYSAFMPVPGSPQLPEIENPPLLREHRLYQADWLLRFYGFKAEELLNQNQPNFNIKLDPKANWALNNFEKFPVEINKTDYNFLLRIPGIGVKSARRIVSSRKTGAVSINDLKKFGTVLKRARYFITCKGKYYGEIPCQKELVKKRLLAGSRKKERYQLSLFDNSVPVLKGKIKG